MNEVRPRGPASFPHFPIWQTPAHLFQHRSHTTSGKFSPPPLERTFPPTWAPAAPCTRLFQRSPLLPSNDLFIYHVPQLGSGFLIRALFSLLSPVSATIPSL